MMSIFAISPGSTNNHKRFNLCRVILPSVFNRYTESFEGVNHSSRSLMVKESPVAVVRFPSTQEDCLPGGHIHKSILFWRPQVLFMVLIIASRSLTITLDLIPSAFQKRYPSDERFSRRQPVSRIILFCVRRAISNEYLFFHVLCKTLSPLQTGGSRDQPHHRSSEISNQNS